MKKGRSLSPIAVGGSSLLVIFSVLCMTVFAMLSLSTAQAEKRMAEAAHRKIISYYEADLQAQAVFARLRSGEMVPEVLQNGQEYHYAVPFSNNQTLEVTLRRIGDDWGVLQWQTVSDPEILNDPLPVWQGEELSDFIKH